MLVVLADLTDIRDLNRGRGLQARSVTDLRCWMRVYDWRTILNEFADRYRCMRRVRWLRRAAKYDLESLYDNRH